MLVFMPGMKEITDAIKELRKHPLLSSDSFWLLPLHSSLGSHEQQMVFKVPPPGYTKIVLSTNIAETSLTIEDVTCVIDCGKMKEMQYDAGSGMSALVTTWVSKANASQRAGRAGRVRAGACYHLFSHRRHDKLAPQQLPEMVRAPLEQLCLRIKVLGLGGIREFLSGALEPPSDDAIDHTIKALQVLGALEHDQEELTPLGHHLAYLPVDARIGKMMIYGSVFRCLDPVLTIAASLSYRSPFFSPFDKREEADKVKRGMTAEKSDHLTVLAAYQGWQMARAMRDDRRYLTKNFLSRNTLMMIADMKRQLADLLADIGFVKEGVNKRMMERLPGDGVLAATGEPANRFSANLRLVEGVLCAGLYPNIIKVIPKVPPPKQGAPYLLKTKDGAVQMHPGSVLFSEASLPSPFLVYHEKVKTSAVFVRDATMITPLQLLLFGGEVAVQHETGTVTVDGWIAFNAKAKVAVLTRRLREKLRELLSAKVERPDLDVSQLGERVIEATYKLLADEVIGQIQAVDLGGKK